MENFEAAAADDDDGAYSYNETEQNRISLLSFSELLLHMNTCTHIHISIPMSWHRVKPSVVWRVTKEC